MNTKASEALIGINKVFSCAANAIKVMFKVLCLPRKATTKGLPRAWADEQRAVQMQINWGYICERIVVALESNLISAVSKLSFHSTRRWRLCSLGTERAIFC